MISEIFFRRVAKAEDAPDRFFIVSIRIKVYRAAGGAKRCLGNSIGQTCEGCNTKPHAYIRCLAMGVSAATTSASGSPPATRLDRNIKACMAAIAVAAAEVWRR